MALWQGRSKRKTSGGRYHAAKSKRGREIGRDALYTRVDKEQKARTRRGRGAKIIRSLQTASFANISEGKKTRKVKVTEVVENAASRHFVRQKVITKGAIVKTEAGLARVTSRPTKDGVVNAVLLKKS